MNSKPKELSKARALYLGCSVPQKTAIGVEAVQEPLCQLYPEELTRIRAIDVWLTVYENGLLLQYVESPTSRYEWFSMRNLYVAAAVKYDPKKVSGNYQFAPLDNPFMKKSSLPPVFAAIFRREKGAKVLECHAFICQVDSETQGLVNACSDAYTNKARWKLPIPFQTEIKRESAPQACNQHQTMSTSEPDLPKQSDAVHIFQNTDPPWVEQALKETRQRSSPRQQRNVSRVDGSDQTKPTDLSRTILVPVEERRPPSPPGTSEPVDLSQRTPTGGTALTTTSAGSSVIIQATSEMSELVPQGGDPQAVLHPWPYAPPQLWYGQTLSPRPSSHPSPDAAQSFTTDAQPLFPPFMHPAGPEDTLRPEKPCHEVAATTSSSGYPQYVPYFPSSVPKSESCTWEALDQNPKPQQKKITQRTPSPRYSPYPRVLDSPRAMDLSPPTAVTMTTVREEDDAIKLPVDYRPPDSNENAKGKHFGEFEDYQHLEDFEEDWWSSTRTGGIVFPGEH